MFLKNNVVITSRSKMIYCVSIHPPNTHVNKHFSPLDHIGLLRRKADISRQSVNIARIANAASHKLPAKSSLNVSFVSPN